MTNKKVLIIAYYWPPAGGPGVQRWLKFVKYLPEFKIEPIVYVPENPNYPIVDKSLLTDVSKDVTVLKLPIKEPYKWANLFSNASKTIRKGIIKERKKQSLIEKLMLYIRGNFFIPDARKAWVKPSVKYLLNYIKENNIETIITTGPPHSMHLIGLHLKTNLNLKWVADFRDPWTTIGYHKNLKLTKASEEKHKQLEAIVLKSADQIIVTSSITKQEFKAITDQPIAVITNGHDKLKSSFEALDLKFTMSHIGSLLSERNPENLWQVLSELVVSEINFAKDFQLNLIGTVSEAVLQSINSYNLKEYLNVIGYVPHDEAMAYQNRSQVLLLIEIDSDETRCIIPGKLFEYMVSKRPIIALGPNGSDVETILKETNSGNYFGYDEHDVLKETILKQYRQYQEGHLKSNPIHTEKYSRRTLTKTLADLL